MNKTIFPLQLVNSDIWGPAPILSVEGYKYYIHFIANFCKFSWIYSLRAKSEAKGIIFQWKNLGERQFNRKLKCLQTDREWIGG